MAALHFQYKDFYNVIKHHIALINRYDNEIEKQFSIAFLSVRDKKADEVAQAFVNILRETDIVFNNGHFYILFLPATDWSGADTLLKELCAFLDQQRKDTIVTYPEDGNSAMSVIAAFENKVQSDYGVVMDIGD